MLIPLIKDFIVCRSAIIEKYYSQAEKQIVCVTDLGEPFNVGNLAKDDLAETGMPCVIYGELFTTYGEIISQIESHTNKTEGMILSKNVKLLKLYLAIENTLYLCIKDKINNEKSYRLYSCFY